jgi:hypothetical protein
MSTNTAKNDITGDNLRTKAQSSTYSDGWERIWGAKPAEDMFQAPDMTTESKIVVKKSQKHLTTPEY